MAGKSFEAIAKRALELEAEKQKLDAEYVAGLEDWINNSVVSPYRERLLAGLHAKKRGRKLGTRVSKTGKKLGRPVGSGKKVEK
jgi:hypothetical protein